MYKLGPEVQPRPGGEPARSGAGACLPARPTLGRYELRGVLGEGGFGTVYRAWDLVLNREVAVKALKPELAGESDFRRRFLGEARAIAARRHPNIVQIYDVGEADGRPFFAMELVEGQTLAALAEQGSSLSVGRLVTILRPLCATLDYLHERGLIHRDVKAANVMVDGDGRVVLMDFGIAHAVQGPGLTRTGDLIGTPEYMAPEQVYGATVTAATDIYALGVLVYHLLAGRPPFIGTTGAVMRGHTSRPPPPLRQFRPDLPEEVERALDRALAKDPADRPASAAALVESLARAMGHTACATTPPPLPLVRRQRTSPAIVMGGAGAVVSLILTAVAVALWFGDDSGQPGINTAGAAVAVSPGASPAPGPIGEGTAVLPRLLLTPGDRVSLTAAPAVELPVPGCSEAKTILRLTSMEAGADGRVTIGFTFEVPRVTGVTCPIIDYYPDANCCSMLVTRRATGPPVESRVNGGSGLAVTGAEDVYGKPEMSGTWVFPNAELDGEDLTLKRFARDEESPFSGNMVFQALLVQRR
jgi:hypothetical protein